jgi:hypothetical protein
MKKLLSFTLILILSAGFITSCKKDKGEPPVLPPAESMSIDFTNFVSGAKSAGLAYDQKGTENSNWEFAAVVAGVWRLILNTTLVVPVASFKLAVNQNPVFLSDKTWQWSYSVTVLGAAYNARLTGQIRTSDVLWKMYITKTGTSGFTEFLWFEGTSNLDGTGGQWIINHSYQFVEPMLQIDWIKSGTSIGSIKYTYIRALKDNRTADPLKDSYITYGLTSTALNAYYTVHYYNGLKSSDVNVEWNSTTYNGRVKCIDYLGDSDWHCWDSNKVNIICP